MTANPLMTRQSTRPGRLTFEMLQELAADLNNKAWVQASRLPYFVNRRWDGEEHTHFLDRKIAPGAH